MQHSADADGLVLLQRTEGPHQGDRAALEVPSTGPRPLVPPPPGPAVARLRLLCAPATDHRPRLLPA
jgi:hypothetical protein